MPSLRRHVARQIKDLTETEPGQRRSRGRVWWNAAGAGDDGSGAGGKVQVPGVDGAGRGKAVQDRGRGRGKGKKFGGGSVPPRQNDVSLGRNPGSFPRRCRRSHEFGRFLVWRCRAHLPSVLVSFPKFLVIGRMLDACSLLV